MPRNNPPGKKEPTWPACGCGRTGDRRCMNCLRRLEKEKPEAERGKHAEKGQAKV